MREMVICSDWTPWRERRNLSTYLQKPGVYVIGVFDTPPVRGELAKGVVYIGIAKSRPLLLRLEEFGKSATSHSIGHSGGYEFNRVCISPEIRRFVCWEMPDNVWLSVIAVNSKAKQKAELIEEFESQLIEKYKCTWGCLPKCNRKI